jgi:Domain of unknown function (DUF955).
MFSYSILGEHTTLKTMIHEIIHAKLHADSTSSFGDPTYSRQEFEAESVAYIVSNHLGSTQAATPLVI